MNVLIINHDSNPQFIGGIKRVCVSLARQWVQHGMEVCFVCVGDIDKIYDEVAGFQQFHLPESINVQSYDNKEYLCKLIREKNIDVLLNPFMDSREVTRLCFDVKKCSGIKLVTAWHFAPTHFIDIVDNNIFIRYHLGNPVRRYAIDFALWLRWKLYLRQGTLKNWGAYFDECIRNSDAVVFLSNKFLPIVEKMVGYHSTKVVAINNPLSYDTQSTIDFSPKENIVLWGGRLGYGAKHTEKMLLVWAHVSVNHQDWKLVVCGSGNADYFRELCSKYNIENVEFPGFVNMEEYYAKAAILCNTSVTEGWGMVLVEAMQYGCIPMAFNGYASVHDIIEDGKNGYIISAFDEDEYAHKLEQLMSDNTLRVNMAKNGLESCQRFAPQQIASQWQNLFDSLSA